MKEINHRVSDPVDDDARPRNLRLFTDGDIRGSRGGIDGLATDGGAESATVGATESARGGSADLTMEGAANFASDEIFEVATIGSNDGAEDLAADGSANFAIEGCSDYYRHHN